MMLQTKAEQALPWVSDPVAEIAADCALRATDHQLQLTKPPGSLGRLESIVCELAGMQANDQPVLDRLMIRVFAADHGVAARGVSAFPQAVTVEMVRNFSRGGAAISVLAAQLAADFGVVNMGTVEPTPDLPGVEDCRLGEGTADFTVAPAMTETQLVAALAVGLKLADQAREADCQLFIGGEMGIGNTTAAAALACVLLGRPPAELVGRGTGVDDQGIALKCEVVATALRIHDLSRDAGLAALRCLGGFEIAALAGSYIALAQRGIPSLVDGFISSVAALAAVTLNSGVRSWLFFSHQSAEAGHALVLAELQAKPMVALEMRLGEGSGAALVVPLMRSACQLHSEMATFADAGVSTS